MSEPLPAVFIGHGSPMNTLESNRYTTAWADIATGIALPGAIVAISAHWYVRATAVTAMTAPRTIHDFGGFPPELHAYRYPAPGSPAIARRVAQLLEPATPVHLDEDQWGLDHGTWSVLAHLYPDADVPVVQLSIDATKPAQDHVAIGRLLAPLREENVLIVASGNVVHNLGAMSPGHADRGFDWAVDFDTAASEMLATRPDEIDRLTEHPQYPLAAPTPEHLLPLFYLAGIAHESGASIDQFAVGYSMGSLSMTCHAAR